MTIADQLESVRQQLRQALADAKRPPDDVELLAVSKTHPPEKIMEAYQCGQRAFGENYTDELISKQSSLAHIRDLRFVYIGQLQSNKIQKIVLHADEIQSLASEKHARYIDRYAAEYDKKNFPVWIVVNAGDEASKQGVSFDELPKLATFIKANCPHLCLQGVMAIPPPTYSDENWQKSGPNQIPELYQRLANAARSVGRGKLSLGMSGDLRLAVAAGSNCIRIGTGIFGARRSPAD